MYSSCGILSVCVRCVNIDTGSALLFLQHVHNTTVNDSFLSTLNSSQSCHNPISPLRVCLLAYHNIRTIIIQ